VPLGFCFAGFYAFFSEPTPTWLWPGMLIAILGLMIRIWASGHLKKGCELCLSGPYRWTRNPLYLGSFLVGIGFSIAAGKLWILLVFLTLFGGVYWPVIKKEEEELRATHGRQYEDYRSKVPSFLPGLQPGLTGAVGHFRTRQVIVNKEYNAVIGSLIVFFFLVVKLMWQ
jgi:protein-S-isoprenylcysteine O-methyltransferase Ste14